MLKRVAVVLAGMGLAICVLWILIFSKGQGEDPSFRVAERFFHIPGLLDWLNSNIDYNTHKQALVLFYENIGYNCDDLDVIKYTYEYTHEEMYFVLVLHSSFKNNDIDIIRNKLDLPINVLIIPNRYGDMWSDIGSAVGILYLNSIVVILDMDGSIVSKYWLAGKGDQILSMTSFLSYFANKRNCS